MRIEHLSTYVHTHPVRSAAITALALVVLVNMYHIRQNAKTRHLQVVPHIPQGDQYHVYQQPKQPPVIPNPPSPPRSPSPSQRATQEGYPETPFPPQSGGNNSSDETEQINPQRKLDFSTPKEQKAQASSHVEKPSQTDNLKSSTQKPPHRLKVTSPESSPSPQPQAPPRSKRHIGTPNAPTISRPLNGQETVPALMATPKRLRPSDIHKQLATKVLDKIKEEDTTLKLTESDEKNLTRLITFKLVEANSTNTEDKKVNDIADDLLKNSYIIKDARARQKEQQKKKTTQIVQTQLASNSITDVSEEEILRIVKTSSQDAQSITDKIKTAYKLREDLPQSTDDFDLTQEEYAILKCISLDEILLINADDVTQHILDASTVVQNAKERKNDQKLLEQQESLIEAVKLQLGKEISGLEIIEISKLIDCDDSQTIANAIKDADRIRKLIFAEFSEGNLSASDKDTINKLAHSSIIKIREEESNGNDFDDSVDIDQTIVDKIIETYPAIKHLHRSVQVNFLKDTNIQDFTPGRSTSCATPQNKLTPHRQPIVPNKAQLTAFQQLINRKLPTNSTKVITTPDSATRTSKRKRRQTAIGLGVSPLMTPEFQRLSKHLRNSPGNSPGTPGNSYESPENSPY